MNFETKATIKKCIIHTMPNYFFIMISVCEKISDAFTQPPFKQPLTHLYVHTHFKEVAFSIHLIQWVKEDQNVDIYKQTLNQGLCFITCLVDFILNLPTEPTHVTCAHTT